MNDTTGAKGLWLSASHDLSLHCHYDFSSFLWITLAVSLLADPSSASSSPHPCCVLGALSMAWRLSLGLLAFPPQPSGATNCTRCPLTAEPLLRPHFPIGLLSQAHLSPLIPDKFRTPTWTPCPSPNLRCAHPMLYSEAVLCSQRKHPQSCISFAISSGARPCAQKLP